MKAEEKAPLSQRVIDEVREIGLVTLHFLFCFLIFLSLKKLLLDDYEIHVSVVSTAVISALVVAKVVILLDKTSFGDRFRSARPFFHVLWRSLGYTAVVFLVTLAEHLFSTYHEKGDFSAAVQSLWAARDAGHFLAMNLCLAISFLAYNCFAEIDRHLGEGGIRKLFFTVDAKTD